MFHVAGGILLVMALLWCLRNPRSFFFGVAVWVAILVPLWFWLDHSARVDHPELFPAHETYETWEETKARREREHQEQIKTYELRYPRERTIIIDQPISAETRRLIAQPDPVYHTFSGAKVPQHPDYNTLDTGDGHHDRYGNACPGYVDFGTGKCR